MRIPEPSSSGSVNDRSQNAHSRQLPTANRVDWNVEYVKAVKTASYNEFWMKVRMLTGKRPDDAETGSVSSEFKFQSFRLVLDSLLDPEQEAVIAMLNDSKNWNRLEVFELVSDYFESSLKASNLCELLLRSLEQARHNCDLIKSTFIVLPCTGETDCDKCQQAMEQLNHIAHIDNPFSEPTSGEFRTVHDYYITLHKRLGEKKKNLDNELKALNCCKSGCAVLLVATIVGVSVSALVIATHALIAVVAAPLVTLPLKSAKKRLHSVRRYYSARHSTQLEAAAKGTFTVNRVLDTIARLLTRLHDELEHNKLLAKFGWQHREQHASVQEVIKQLWKSHMNMHQQLQELEEHVYHFFMIINRARSLVVREIVPLCL
eukprot:c21383_g1_i1 orf=2956-4080(+)